MFSPILQKSMFWFPSPKDCLWDYSAKLAKYLDESIYPYAGTIPRHPASLWSFVCFTTKLNYITSVQILENLLMIHNTLCKTSFNRIIRQCSEITRHFLLPSKILNYCLKLKSPPHFWFNLSFQSQKINFYHLWNISLFSLHNDCIITLFLKTLDHSWQFALLLSLNEFWEYSINSGTLPDDNLFSING